MYLEHFRLTEYPFGITPDTSFFFSSRASQEALNTLLVAARAGEGFIKITGEVGTGKTLLCRQLLNSLGTEFRTAYIPNPYLSPPSLLQELAVELGADLSEVNRSAEMLRPYLLSRVLTQRLMELAREGQRVLVCLDDAQAMPIVTLESLRLLTNLETEKRKLLQVVIFGQPELNQVLDSPTIRQLRQRITFEYELGPLTGSELVRYLNHRMSIAGYRGPGAFSSSAVRLLHWRTRGYPRLINIVAHKALLCAYGRGRPDVGLREMKAAIDDTSSLASRSRLLADFSLASLGALILHRTRGV